MTGGQGTGVGAAVSIAERTVQPGTPKLLEVPVRA